MDLTADQTLQRKREVRLKKIFINNPKQNTQKKKRMEEWENFSRLIISVTGAPRFRSESRKFEETIFEEIQLNTFKIW